uniref:Uncharacterized protein n=1 Tax=Micrurus corallinus TaxID=54390 RepID=A0A2D4GLX6_MICCO
MSNEYIAHSYNFFLFPATFGQMDSEFSCQTSSIQFLSHYDFDYNKFLKDGIPYMNETQEKKLQHLLSGNWMVQSFHKDKVKKAIDQVTCWISSAEEEDSMVLHDIYGFQVIELQLILRKAFPDIWTIPLEDEKPLVGHNMLMDLLYLHEKFYKPLPENYEEFKDNIHFLFPVLLDTKNIAKATRKEFQFPQVSYLLELYETLCSVVNPTDQLCPEIFHSDDSLRYAINKCPHEAAYDAFLCGAVLLKIAHLLLCRKTGHQTAAPTFSQYLDVLAAYVNQVNLIRGAIQKINFSGADDLTTRLPLLLATVKGWRGATEEQIHQELRSFCKFDVRWLRKNQFLLVSNHFKDTRIVMKVYKAHPNLQISMYHHWKHSPQVTSFLQICGIVASWSLLAFLLGGSYSCRV